MGMLDRVRQWWAPARRPVTLAEPWLDLPLRRETATRAARAADAALQEGMLSIGGQVIDLDDPEYRRLSSGQRFRTRDLTPMQQDRMLQIAWYLVEANPFAKRLIGLMRDLVVGEGITCSSKDARVQSVLTQTWKHPINRLDYRTGELYYAFSLNGELILPVARNPITGIPHLGYLDPMQVERVETREDNVMVPETIVLRPSAGQAEGPRLQIVAEDPVSGLLTGDVFYFRTNALPNSGRGRSDLLTLADWLDLYDSLMFSEVERLKLMSAFVWDLTMEGASQTEIAKRVKELGNNPPAGTVFGHNQKERLEARTPNLQATDRSEVARMLAIHIAGSIGFPITWLGFADSNRATIEGQNDVMFKTPAARQKEFAGHLSTILRYAVEGATTKNRALYREVRDVTWEVHVPEIAAKDIARVGGVIANVVTAMDTAQANATISRRAAVQVQLAVMRHLGVQLDVEEVLAEADAELAERQASADERAALLAQARAATAALDADPARAAGG